MSSIIVTGAAGFIGFHLAAGLLREGHKVLGIDNLNEYYDVQLKRDRLSQISKHPGFSFCQVSLEDMQGLTQAFDGFKPEYVVNLAAQAGVRYSITNPKAYIDSNLVGFANILECCRHQEVKHLLYASSSSVYGANTHVPFSTHDHADHPLSLYAATKKANELMAHTYAHLYRLPCTGLRFFTVYGEWGRPDMAVFLFTKAIFEGKPIQVFNNGNMKRDFTYVDDVVSAIVKLVSVPAEPSLDWDSNHPVPSKSSAPYRLYNIGNHSPVELMTMIDCLEKEIGKKAIRNFQPMQMGDVPSTYADVSDLMQETGFSPSTPIEDGLKRFVAWYRDYYKIES